MREILAFLGLLAFLPRGLADENPRRLLTMHLQVAQLAQIESQPTPLTIPFENQHITAALAREPAGEALTTVPPDTPKLYLRWQGDGLNTGDKIRCIWVAEDVGDAAPTNYHIDEAFATAGDSRPFGTFILLRPKKRWPVGKYRAEIYVGDKLTETVRFTIE